MEFYGGPHPFTVIGHLISTQTTCNGMHAAVDIGHMNAVMKNTP